MGGWVEHIAGTIDGRGARSTAVLPLQWGMAIVGTAAIVAALGGVTWLAITFTSLFTIVTIMFCASYIYFMRQDPDRLHTEGYRLAMEEMLLRRKAAMYPDKSFAPAEGVGYVPDPVDVNVLEPHASAKGHLSGEDAV